MPVRKRSTIRRNDIRQYEDLADEWTRPDGLFAMLGWIARARASLIPVAPRPGAVLVDLGCGGGLMAPYVRERGYQHVGVDLGAAGLRHAAQQGVETIQADVHAVPLAGGCADVVCAGEILEHVEEPSIVVREAVRILRPGGLLVVDTINATLTARVVAIWLAERLASPQLRGIHDPRLLVPLDMLVKKCDALGVPLRVQGLRPRMWPLLSWLVRRRGEVAMVPTWFTAVLYQGWGRKGIDGRSV